MKFFYEAGDKDGARVRGMVEADSALDALSQLEAGGLLEPQLISAASVLDDQYDDLAPEEQQQLARDHVAYLRAPSPLASLLLAFWHVTRGNALILVGVAAAAALAFGLGHLRLAGGLALVLLVPYGVMLWKRRSVDAYRELQRCMAIGDWPQARQWLARLRRQDLPGDSLAMDLDVREAQVDVRQGRSLPDALEQLQDRWAASMAADPGAFEGRMLSVYAAAGDHAGFLRTAQAYLAAQPDAPDRRLECALAEVHFGRPEAARRLLASIDTRLLMPFAVTFYHQAAGSLALRMGYLPQALRHLQQATDEFAVMAANTPVALTNHALCVGNLAVALARDQRRADGLALLAEVQQPLRVWADPHLKELLARELDWR